MVNDTIQSIGMAIVTALAVIAVAGISVDQVYNLRDSIRAENTDIISNRLETSIYSMKAVGEGELQVNLQAEYVFTEDAGTLEVTYDSDGAEEREIDPPVDYNTASFSGNERTEYVCITKTWSSITVELERCF